MGLFLLFIPAVAALLLAFFRQKRVQHIISLSASALMAAAAVPLTREVMLSGKVAYSSLGGFFYVDSLSIIVLDIVLAPASRRASIRSDTRRRK
jgi:hydrogenase-4 component F